MSILYIMLKLPASLSLTDTTLTVSLCLVTMPQDFCWVFQTRFTGKQQQCQTQQTHSLDMPYLLEADLLWQRDPSEG